ncbi:transposable element Tcb2 transposase [Trichonephila clavipes]|nr:transposable element Tcb2 transposase [Trichonephila clavipes]
MTVPVIQSVSGLCNARFTVWVSGAVDVREYHCSMLTIGLHVLLGKTSQRMECGRLKTNSMGCNGVFHQNNCTSHKFQLATGWLDEHSSDFSVINWPPRRSDLNPIENLWDVLKLGVKCHHTASTK